MVDPGGNDPFGVLDLNDYIMIHFMVQLQCATNYGMFMEIYVKGPDGKGFLDLFDPIHNTYYEVKSDGVPSSVYENQMKKYNTATVRNTRGNRRKVDNIDYYSDKQISPGEKSDIAGSFQYGIHDVSYSYSGPGLIQYSISPNQQRQEELAKTELLAGGAALAVLLAFFAPEFIPAEFGAWGELVYAIA